MSEQTQGSCTACGSPQPPLAWRCECGGAFDIPELAANGFTDLGKFMLEPGLQRYRRWIPVPNRLLAEVSMGEGGTPMIAAGPELPRMYLKIEFVSPTLSFKDRGAVVLIAAALERRAHRVIADSSGNAGSAIAAYASRAGIECRVFVPQGTSPGKQAQIRAFGATLEEVAGDRTATTEAAIAAVQETGAMYASHIYDPLFLQGTKTFAFEVTEQLGGAPDAVVVPVGNGTLLLGAAHGFRELRAAGAIDRAPALIGVQSERCAPLAVAWDRGEATPATVRAEQTLAEGIAIPRPARGAQILAAVADSGGCMVAVPERAIEPARRALARKGLLVEPTGAVTWAGALLARGDPLGDGDGPSGVGWDRARTLTAGTLVIPLCGSGVKATVQS
ncbi:MAG: threonine synthase [Actinomycetota bacterium]|nr:threonine synthase [Actinomycetota bacterium]